MTGTGGSFSANAAEQSGASCSPATLRTNSAAAVLMGAANSAAASGSGSSPAGSPVQAGRRFGSSTAAVAATAGPGHVMPSSASPDSGSRRTSGTFLQQGAAALRAQTAAAALSNGSGSGSWGVPEQQSGSGSAAGSPSKAGARLGSGGAVGRRGAVERPQTVGPADVDSAELSPLPDPEGTLR
jgi:hypothetical protein